MKKINLFFGLFLLMSLNACSSNPVNAGGNTDSKQSALDQSKNGNVVHLIKAIDEVLLKKTAN